MFTPDFSFLDYIFLSRAAGLIGFAVYVCGFFCLSTGRLDSSKPIYFALTLTAASCVLLSLWADFNLSAALIQIFYIFMSIGGIILRRLQSPKLIQIPITS